MRVRERETLEKRLERKTKLKEQRQSASKIHTDKDRERERREERERNRQINRFQTCPPHFLCIRRFDPEGDSHLMLICKHQCRSDISRINGWFRGVGLQGAVYGVGCMFKRGRISAAPVTVV